MRTGTNERKILKKHQPQRTYQLALVDIHRQSDIRAGQVETFNVYIYIYIYIYDLSKKYYSDYAAFCHAGLRLMGLIKKHKHYTVVG